MPMAGRVERGFFVNESHIDIFAIQLQNISCNFAPENNKTLKDYVTSSRSSRARPLLFT